MFFISEYDIITEPARSMIVYLTIGMVIGAFIIAIFALLASRSPEKKMSSNPIIATLGRRLRLAVIGGGPGSFIGGMHRMAARIDDRYELVAGVLSSDTERAIARAKEIGLQEVVNGHSHFLHDGRARNYVEAIMWHGGEGDVSRQIFKNMTKEERDALVMYLRSL